MAARRRRNCSAATRRRNGSAAARRTASRSAAARQRTVHSAAAHCRRVRPGVAHRTRTRWAAGAAGWGVRCVSPWREPGRIRAAAPRRTASRWAEVARAPRARRRSPRRGRRAGRISRRARSNSPFSTGNGPGALPHRHPSRTWPGCRGRTPCPRTETTARCPPAERPDTRGAGHRTPVARSAAASKRVGSPHRASRRPAGSAGTPGRVPGWGPASPTGSWGRRASAVSRRTTAPRGPGSTRPPCWLSGRARYQVGFGPENP